MKKHMEFRLHIPQSYRSNPIGLLFFAYDKLWREHFFEGSCRHRLCKEKALDIVAMIFLQEMKLLIGLYPFCRDMKS